MRDASGGSAASAPDAGGSPGTSTLAPGSPQQDAKQDDADLLKAKMALNPLSNTTPPNEDDIGVGDDE